MAALGGLLACHCDNSPVAAVAFTELTGVIVFGVPAAIPVALMKYRLYDLDIVVSKALVYGLLAALFTAVYVAIVIGVGAVVGDRGSSFLTTLAAVAIAVTFQPVRERVRHLANRMVYGKRATQPLGTGLQGMRDRLEALRGTLSVASSLGSGTTVTGSTPARAEVPS